MSLTRNKGKDIGRSGFRRLFSQIVEKGFCVGCGTCVGVCPFSALRMKETNAGYWVPVCDEETNCRSCEFCLDTCPAMSMAIPSSTNWPLSLMSYETNAPPLGSVEEAYIGYAKDQRTRTNGSSGGITSAILICALESGLIDGAIVVGMNQEQPWKPQVKIAKTKEEIIEAAGSKYSVVPVNSILQSLRKVSGKFALVGLPCHIRGLQLARKHGLEMISKKIVFTAGLFCGLNLRTTATAYLLRKIGIENPRTIEKLEYRHGYPGSFYVRLTNRECYVPKKDYEFLNLLFRYEACKYCNDLSNELADISIGDIFSLRSKDPVGVALSRSKIGENILKEASLVGDINLKKISINEVIESQLAGLIYKKRGAPVRKYISGLKQKDRKCCSRIQEVVPEGKEMTFEIFQQRILFGRTNRLFVATSEYLPLHLVSYFYKKALVLLFIFGKLCYRSARRRTTIVCTSVGRTDASIRD